MKPEPEPEGSSCAVPPKKSTTVWRCVTNTHARAAFAKTATVFRSSSVRVLGESGAIGAGATDALGAGAGGVVASAVPGAASLPLHVTNPKLSSAPQSAETRENATRRKSGFLMWSTETGEGEDGRRRADRWDAAAPGS